MAPRKFGDWVECHKANNGHRGNVFQSFSSLVEAELAWTSYKNLNEEAQTITTKPKDSKEVSSSNPRSLDPQANHTLHPPSPLVDG
jgi:hypothetical protein